MAVWCRETDGNLYGTTRNGGANSYGAVFKITPSAPAVSVSA